MTYILSKCKQICGITLYSKYRSENSIKRIYLGGLYKEIVQFNNYGESCRQSYLIGIPLFGRKIENNIVCWYIGRSLLIKRTKVAHKLALQLNSLFNDVSIKKINGKKNIFIFWANSGEIAILLMFFFSEILEKHNIHSPDDLVVLCTKKYHLDMLLMYFPKIQAVVSKPKILRYVSGDMTAEDWNVHMCFPGKYFAEFEATASKSPINYLNWMSNWFNININKPIKPNKEIVNIAYINARKKLSSEQLASLDGHGKGLVIIALQSFSGLPINQKTQSELKNKLEQDGYTILENKINQDTSFTLTYPEIYAIAEKSVKLFALRSGLVDFLTNSGIVMHVFYTAFPDRGFNTPPKTATQVFDLFSLKALPLENAKSANEQIMEEI